MYSRQTQKLLFSLFQDIANFRSGSYLGSKTKTLELDIVKREMTGLFLKAKGYKAKDKSLESYLELLDNKDNIDVDSLQKEFITAIQNFLIKKNEFSVALRFLNQKVANDFVEYLFDFMMENDIPMRKENADLYAQDNHDKFMYKMLILKKCCICGRLGELEHQDNVSRKGGYKYDDGRNERLMCLCREHHSQRHSDYKFYEKYDVEGIYLTDEQIEYLKKNVYKNHFKNFKKEVQ